MVRAALLIAALAVSGTAFASVASASSVSVTDLRLYNGSTQVTPAAAPAGSQRGFWLQIKYTNGLAAGQKVTILGPVGASFSSSPSDYLFHVSGGTPSPSAAALVSGGRGVVLTLPVSATPIAANDTRYLTFGGGYPNVSKTGVGTTKGNAQMTVSTTNDVDPANSPSYEITPGAVNLIGIPGGGGLSATVGTNFSNSGQVIGAYDAFGNGIPGQQVDLTTPSSGPSGTFAGGVRTTSVTTGSAGQALIPTTTAGTVAGSWNMTASAPGGTPSNTIPRTNVAGVAEDISISLNPTSIVANGTSQSTATVIVSDAYANRRSADDVRIGAIVGGPTIGTVTSQGNGVYTAPVTSSTTKGNYSITATDHTPPTPIGANPATLTQTAGPIHHIGVPASTVSTTVGTAFPAGGQGITAFDQFDNSIPSQQLTVSTPESGASGTFAGGAHSITVTTNSVGQAAVPETTANTVAGSWQMTASAPGGSPSNTFTRSNLAGAPATVSLSLDPASLPADGTSQAVATAEVTDSFGNAVEGQDVTFETSGGQAIGTVIDHEDGSYSAPLTATTTPGASTITATDHTPVPSIVSGPATLTQTSVTPPPPTVVKPVLGFVKPPKPKTRASKAKFRFKVLKGKAKGFQCKLDKQKWASCKSPKVVKLKRGKHVFQVRGIATDGTFGKPIKRKIRRVSSR